MEVRNKRLTRCRARVSSPNLRPEIIYLIINLITFVRSFNSKKSIVRDDLYGSLKGSDRERNSGKLIIKSRKKDGIKLLFLL